METKLKNLLRAYVAGLLFLRRKAEVGTPIPLHDLQMDVYLALACEYGGDSGRADEIRAWWKGEKKFSDAEEIARKEIDAWPTDPVAVEPRFLAPLLELLPTPTASSPMIYEIHYRVGISPMRPVESSLDLVDGASIPARLVELRDEQGSRTSKLCWRITVFFLCHRDEREEAGSDHALAERYRAELDPRCIDVKILGWDHDRPVVQVDVF